MTDSNESPSTTNTNQEGKYNSLLDNLDTLVDELVASYEDAESIFIAHNTQFGLLNTTLLLNIASLDELMELFQNLCIIKNINEEDFSVIQFLFKFIASSLINSKELNSTELQWSDFVYILNTNLNDPIFKIDNTPNKKIQKPLKSYLRRLPDWNVSLFEQSAETNATHVKYTEILKQIFYFKSEAEIIHNPIIMETITKIMNKQNIEVESNIQHYINSIYFDNITNKQNTDAINELVEFISDTDSFKESSYISYNMIDALIRKDKKDFLNSMEDYAQFYWKNEIFDNEGKSNTTPYDKTKLTESDKAVMFFATYFQDIHFQGNAPFIRVIDLLFSYYDKEIFTEFMHTYNLPYNSVVRSEEMTTGEGDEVVAIQIYTPLFEYAFSSGAYEIAMDIHENNQAMQPYYLNVIENKTVYEYNSPSSFSNFPYSEIDILFLINKEILNKDSYLPFYSDNQYQYTDLFQYTLKLNFQQAFLKLYFKSKEKEADFSLKTEFHNSDLFITYLNTQSVAQEVFFNPVIIQTFITEGYNLLETNSENNSVLDIIKHLSPEIGSGLILMLEELFEKEYSLSNTPKKQEPIIKNNNSEYVEWFNKNELIAHLKTISSDKDNNNIEIIKSMLSNNNHLRKKLTIQDESFFTTLEARFPNFKEVINYYKGQFRLKKLSGKNYIPPILLLGEPGIGKTLFAKELAQFLNTGYTFIDMGSLTAGWILSGNNGTWKSAKQGKILDAMLKNKSANPLILIDELDKATHSTYDPTLVLYQLLEIVNAKEFTDEFIDFSFDASGIMYVACANTIQTLSEPLLSRFKIFNIKKPDENQIVNIIQNIYSDAVKDTSIFEPQIKEDIITLLKTFSLRTIRVAIDEAISNVLLELTEENIQQLIDNNKFVSLNKSHFKDPTTKNMIGFK